MPVSTPAPVSADVSSRLIVGESTIDRTLLNSALIAPASQSMRFTYFTARKTESVTQVRAITGGTAAGATPTLARMGIYEEAANGDLTLVGSTPNDTALFGATSTRYTKSLSAPFTKVAGRRYAFSILVVSAATMPAFPGLNFASGGSAGANAEFAETPRLAAALSGQADLPASVAAGSLVVQSQMIYAVLLP